MKKRRLLTLFVCGMCLVGCSNSQGTTSTATEEIAWNDYNGAYDRTVAIKEQIEALVSGFADTEYSDLQNYWEDAEFFCLNFDPIDGSCVEKTYYYNEEQTSWEETVALLEALWGETAPDTLTYTRTSPHHYKYSISQYEELPYALNDNTVYGERVVVSEYDTNNDWMQSVAKFQAMNEDWVYDNLFEYARIANGAIFQTGTERILVYFADDWEPITMPVLKEREVTYTDEKGNEVTTVEQYVEEIEMEEYKGRVISELYYSKLSDNVRNSYLNYEYEYVSGLDYDELVEYAQKKDASRFSYISWDGFYEKRYSLQDSLFTHVDDIDMDWVIGGDEIYESTIVYQRGEIDIEIYNDLSGKIETVSIDKAGHITLGEKELESVEAFDFDAYYEEAVAQHKAEEGY